MPWRKRGNGAFRAVVERAGPPWQRDWDYAVHRKEWEGWNLYYRSESMLAKHTGPRGTGRWSVRSEAEAAARDEIRHLVAKRREALADRCDTTTIYESDVI